MYLCVRVFTSFMCMCAGICSLCMCLYAGICCLCMCVRVRVFYVCVFFRGCNGTGRPDLDFSMTAGDFVEVYGSIPNSWDCVITCFFIDTAPVVLTYIDVIHRILKPGGFWINLGKAKLRQHVFQRWNPLSVLYSPVVRRFHVCMYVCM